LNTCRKRGRPLALCCWRRPAGRWCRQTRSCTSRCTNCSHRAGRLDRRCLSRAPQSRAGWAQDKIRPHQIRPRQVRPRQVRPRQVRPPLAQPRRPQFPQFRRFPRRHLRWAQNSPWHKQPSRPTGRQDSTKIGHALGFS
jgi:hypothetical protein